MCEELGPAGSQFERVERRLQIRLAPADGALQLVDRLSLRRAVHCNAHYPRIAEHPGT